MFHHLLGGGAVAVEDANDVNVEHTEKVLRGNGEKGLSGDDAGVGDHCRKRAVNRNMGRDEGGNGVGRGDVGGEGVDVGVAEGVEGVAEGC